MNTARPPSATDSGLTLLEVLVATALFAIVVMGVASVFVGAARSVLRAKEDTIATLLAVERMEQIRSLDWGLGDAATPVSVSDYSTDLSATPAAAGGVGLGVAPSSTLVSSTAGYADFLDADGKWLARGTLPPAGAVFVRRWNVARLGPGSDALVIQVVVSRRSGALADPLRPDDVRLVTVKARKAY